MACFTGSFNDGRTAARRAAVAELTGTDLTIRDPGGERLARWPLGKVRLVDAEPGGPVRLRREGDDARLTIDEPEVLERLRVVQPAAVRRGRWLLRWPGITVAAAAAVALVVGVLAALDRLVPLVAELVPPAWEERLGRRVRADVVAWLSDGRTYEELVCRAEPGRTVLEEALVDRLAGGLEGRRRPEVSVVDIDEANAIAVPGGHIVVFHGLLDAARSGDEVAGVLAHEMAHAALDHPMQGLVRSMGLWLLVGAVTGGGAGEQALAGTAVVLANNAYSRAAEREADRWAVELMNRTNIRAEGLASFLRRMSRDRGAASGRMSFLSTHPPSRARARAVERAATGSGRPLTRAEWRALRRICPVERWWE